MKHAAFALAGLLLVGLPASLRAGCCLGPRIGVRAGYALPVGWPPTVDFGLYARSELPFHFEVEPNIEYWSSEGVRLLAGNVDLRWRAKILSGLLHPFLGAGVSAGRLWNYSLHIPEVQPDTVQHGIGLVGLAGIELTFLPLINFVLQGRYVLFPAWHDTLTPTWRVLSLTLGADFGF